MLLRSIYVMLCISHPLFSLSIILLLSRPQFAHAFTVDAYLGASLFLATMNKDFMNIRVQVFVWQCSSLLSEKLPKSGTAGVMVFFQLLRSCQTVFKSACIILCSHHQYIWELPLLCICEHLALSFFFILAVLMSLSSY